MSHATIAITPPHAQRGLSLFEVLITVVVVSVGLLGLAGLQFAGLRASNNAQDATYAMQLAQDLADRIRANRVEALSSSSRYAFSINAATGPQPYPSCIASSCSSEDIFRIDRYELHQRMYPNKYGTSNTPILPNPSLSVTQFFQAFTITVNWGDNQSLQLQTFVPGQWVP